MNEIIFLIEKAPEGGYNARALGFSIFTEAETVKGLKTNITEAVYCHFEENALPKIVQLCTVKKELLILKITN